MHSENGMVYKGHFPTRIKVAEDVKKRVYEKVSIHALEEDLAAKGLGDGKNEHLVVIVPSNYYERDIYSQKERSGLVLRTNLHLRILTGEDNIFLLVPNRFSLRNSCLRIHSQEIIDFFPFKKFNRNFRYCSHDPICQECFPSVTQRLLQQIHINGNWSHEFIEACASY